MRCSSKGIYMPCVFQSPSLQSFRISFIVAKNTCLEFQIYFCEIRFCADMLEA